MFYRIFYGALFNCLVNQSAIKEGRKFNHSKRLTFNESRKVMEGGVAHVPLVMDGTGYDLHDMNGGGNGFLWNN